MRKSILIPCVVLLFALLTGYYFYKTQIAPISYVHEPTPVACTEEAMVCPDGSSVGRTGPNCEFSDCPRVPVPEATTTVTTEWSLGTAGIQNGITITPTSIVEDSRCPIDVVCIQAGTVRVRTMLSRGDTRNETIFMLGTPVSFAGKNIVLRSVIPATESKTPLAPEDYRFYFVVTNEIASLVETGTLVGHMTLGPVCPVEREGEVCTPTEAMYAARAISVYTQDNKTLVTTLVPDSEGTFTAKLREGSYYLELADPRSGIGGATGLPRTLAIEAGKTTRIDVSVDTGIR